MVLSTLRKDIYELINNERDRQDSKWGSQRSLDEHVWNTVLGEEVGEVAEAVLEYKFATYQDDPEKLENLRTELVQVAAVCVAWLECYG